MFTQYIHVVYDWTYPITMSSIYNNQCNHIQNLNIQSQIDFISILSFFYRTINIHTWNVGFYMKRPKKIHWYHFLD